MMRLSRKMIFLFLFLAQPWVDGNAQFDLSEYGIQKHGLSIEEPFHTGRHMYQDSLGRLIVHNSVHLQHPLIFDGKKFRFSTYKYKRKLRNNFKAQHWYETDAFMATYDDGDLLFEINTREYLERNISFLHREGSSYYLFCNDGYIKFRRNSDGFEYVESRQLNTRRIIAAHFSSDTIFLKTNHQLGYIIEGQPGDINWYEIEGLQNTDLFVLKDGRIVLDGKKGKHLVDKNSAFHSFLFSQQDGFESLYVDSKGQLWFYIRNEDYTGPYFFGKKDYKPTALNLGMPEPKSHYFTKTIFVACGSVAQVRE